MQRLKKILIALSILITLVLATVFIIIRYYEDDVVRYALLKSKEHMISRMEVGSADLNFWKTFPSASIQFEDVFIEDPIIKDDTLLFAKKVYLKFSLMDLFRGKYNIREVAVHNAKTNLRINKKNEDNWHFWKPSADEEEDFKVKLEKVLLEETRIIYADEPLEFYIDVDSKKTIAAGDFSSGEFELDLQYDGTIHEFLLKYDDYAVNKKLRLEATIKANTDQKKYEIVKANARSENVKMNVEGSIESGDKTTWNLTIAGANNELDDLASLLPEKQKYLAEEYRPSGTVNFNLTIKGKDAPKMTLRFGVENGKIKHKATGTVLNNIYCKAIYSQRSGQGELNLEQFNSNLNEGNVAITGLIKTGQKTSLDLDVAAKVELMAIKNFFALDTLETCNGLVTGSAKIQGELRKNTDKSEWDYTTLHLSGQTNLTDGEFKLKNSNRQFSGLSAEILYNKRDASVQRLEGTVNGSSFKINGTLQNLVPFIINSEERLTVDASLSSSLIDFGSLVETDASTHKNQDYLFELPDRIDCSLNCNIKEFRFREFNATNIKAIARIKAKELIIDPLSFNSSEGKLMAQIQMKESSSNSYKFTCLANLREINIQTLFKQFENFDQNFIRDTNLRGKADATVTFKSEITKSLDIREDKVESIIDIAISNGQLIGLPALQDLAQYLGQNKWIAPFVDEQKFAEKMKDIRFSTLENTIEIKNKMINIPLMDIRSSAMDIKAKGQHGFDKKIDYTIGFSLRDVMVKKEKEWQEADDGQGKKLFVYMRGTTENPVFGVDKEMAKSTRQEEMQQEKQNVKALLKEEFGLFKKDKSVTTYKEKEQTKGSTTTIEWEGFDAKEQQTKSELQEKKQTQQVQPEPLPDTPKKKTPKWLKEKE